MKQDSKGREKKVWLEAWNPRNDKVASSMAFLYASYVPDLVLVKQQHRYAKGHRQIKPALVKGEEKRQTSQ